jgi:hypothetical protein
MGENDGVMQLLGRIDGKLDQVIDAAKEHREDDKRRFGEVYTRLGEHDQEIATAKGAKGVILWLIGGGAAAIGALAAVAAKAYGG